jgi:hypothetical protein
MNTNSLSTQWTYNNSKEQYSSKKEEDDWVRKLFGEYNNQIDQINITRTLLWAMVKSEERQDDLVNQGETSSLFKFDDNDTLIIHQSAVMWFECTHGGKESKMRIRSNENGPVEVQK